VRAHRGKRKNDSIRKRAQLAGWFVNFKKFSQASRSGQAEAVVALRSKLILYS